MRFLKYWLRNAHIQIHVLAHSISVNETTSVVVIASMSLAGIQAIARQVSIVVTANVLQIAPYVPTIATACHGKRVVVLRALEKT